MKIVLFLKLIKDFIDKNKNNELKELLNTMHIADLAEIMDKLKPSEREKIYNVLDIEDLALLATELNKDLQEELIALVDNKRLKKMFEQMSNDDIVDIFGEFSDEQVKKLMNLLDLQERKAVQKLRVHESDTAGGLMTTDYFSVFQGTKINDVIDSLRKIGEEAELVYYIYVIKDVTEELAGIVSLRDIITSDPNIVIDEIMEENIISVGPETDQEKVASYISRYDLLAIPVLDEHNRLLGIITVDDIIDVIEEEATEDIYTMAGMAKEEIEDSNSIFSSVKIRLPWLMISLFGELGSALIMERFGGALNKLVALAFFVPLIMAMGGNSGSQSSAVMVRKIALGEDKTDKKYKFIIKESLSGIFLGAISGVMVGSIAYMWQGQAMLGFIIGFALFLAIAFAAAFGVFIPIIFNKLKIDPAVASGPLITTLNDLGGILIYFGLATYLMSVMDI